MNLGGFAYISNLAGSIDRARLPLQSKRMRVLLFCAELGDRILFLTGDGILIFEWRGA